MRWFKVYHGAKQNLASKITTGLLLSPAFCGAAPPASEPFQHPLQDCSPRLAALIVPSSSCSFQEMQRNQVLPKARTLPGGQRATTRRGPESPGGGAEIRGLKPAPSGISRGERTSRIAHVTRWRLCHNQNSNPVGNARCQHLASRRSKQWQLFYQEGRRDLLVYLHIFS